MHLLFPKYNKYKVYLLAQQLFGAPVLFTFLYFFHTKRFNYIKKSVALSLFILSVMCAIGEFSSVFDINLLPQGDNKSDIAIIGEIIFLLVTFISSLFIYHKYSKYE
jgi:hypothetical protein